MTILMLNVRENLTDGVPLDRPEMLVTLIGKEFGEHGIADWRVDLTRDEAIEMMLELGDFVRALGAHETARRDEELMK